MVNAILRDAMRVSVVTLKSRGCAKVMICELRVMCPCTMNMLRSLIVEATVGARQGGFIVRLEKVVWMIQHNVYIRMDFGGNATYLMDVKVIPATARETYTRKQRVALLLSRIWESTKLKEN